jgi:hypothetical protein
VGGMKSKKPHEVEIKLLHLVSVFSENTKTGKYTWKIICIAAQRILHKNDYVTSCCNTKYR